MNTTNHFRKLWRTLAIVAIALLAAPEASAANPFLPLWEYIPDGEPYVFEDPDNPGKYRVYVYGSHDILVKEYCGRDQVVWSAPVDDLNHWRYDGVIFESKYNRHSELLHGNAIGDVLYAPDVAENIMPDGTKKYYLYPNNQVGGRNGMVCVADRPDGPFQVLNWSEQNENVTDGVLRFDPAVFVDDDGRVYGYWGFERSYGAELDPATMATVKPGTEIVEDMIPGYKQDETFRFFEASSIRKIKGKYVLIYSRWTRDGEFGLPFTNYTLAYAWSDSPLGPFTYGGTIIDGRGRETDDKGVVRPTAHPGGNTHGSIVEINGQWYVFYHRQCGTTEYSRQAMVAPIDVKVTADKVEISEGEYNSEGFEINGLNPLEAHAAGIACYYTGPQVAAQEYPNYFFNGPYPFPVRINHNGKGDPYAPEFNRSPVVHITDGSVVGYKYFNFSHTNNKKGLVLRLSLVPQGVDGTIDVYVDSPKGRKIGSATLTQSQPQQPTDLDIPVDAASRLKGKHALYFVFSAKEKDTSICQLDSFIFM